MKLEVMTSHRVLYSGEADMVVLPAWQGEMGVLAGHADFVVMLKAGRVRLLAGGKTETIHVSGGFAEVSHDRVVVLPDEADVASGDRSVH
jgi:F-type H+-transporting ATPase subunit epsilon